MILLPASELLDAMIFEKFPDRPIQQRIVNDVRLDKTIRHLREFILTARKDNRLVFLSRAVVRSCNGRDFDCMARVIYRFLTTKIKYHRDPDRVEWLQDHEVTLRVRSGDCDDFTILGSAMLGAVGIQTRVKIVQANVPEWNHVYLEYYSPRQQRWIPFDASERKFVGWEYAKIVKSRIIDV